MFQIIITIIGEKWKWNVSKSDYRFAAACMNAPLSLCVFVSLFTCIWTRFWSAVIFIVCSKKTTAKAEFVTKITDDYTIITLTHKVRTQDKRKKAMKVLLSENITCLSQRMNIAPFSHSFVQRVLCIIIANRALWKGNDTIVRVYVRWAGLIATPLYIGHVILLMIMKRGNAIEQWTHVLGSRPIAMLTLHKMQTQWKWYIKHNAWMH